MLTTSPSPQFLARLAGVLYLVVVPLGIFSLYVASSIIVAGDPAVTASNIVASESLFRLGAISDMAAAIVMLLVVLTLYPLLKPVNRDVARLMVAFLAVGVPIALAAKVNLFAALSLAKGATFLAALPVEQAHALMYLLLRASSVGGTIAFIFWGLWLLPLGYLVYQSGFIPRLLGVLLMLACFGYLINSTTALLGLPLNVGMFSAVGEILFILWLLVKGVAVKPSTAVLSH